MLRMRDQMKLRAFEVADAVALQIYRVTEQFPRSEQFGLTSQMRRAAVSVACNIVEDCARFTRAEYVRFLDMAYASSRELEYQVSLFTRLGYLPRADAKSLESSVTETSRVLAGLLHALRKPTNNAKPSSGEARLT
jgi:four helix bundle protein